MEDNGGSSDSSSYFADEESDEDNRRETTDLTSPVSFGPSTSSSGFSFGCNYDVREEDEGRSRSRRARSLPPSFLVEREASAEGAHRSQSIDHGTERRRPILWLEDLEVVGEPEPFLSSLESFSIVEESRGPIGRRQSLEIFEELRYPAANVTKLARSQKERVVDTRPPKLDVVLPVQTCPCPVEQGGGGVSNVQPLATVTAASSRKTKTKSELKYHRLPKHERQGFRTYIKSLFPIHRLLNVLRKRVVVRPDSVLYFPRLSKPIELSTSDYVLDLKLSYGRRQQQFVLVKTLDGLGGQHSRMFLATHDRSLEERHNASCFLVLKSFRKVDGPVRLDTTSPRLIIRRELRVFKRLATLKESATRFVVQSAGVLENEHAHYVVMPAMFCDLLDVLLKKTKIKKDVFAKAWIAQLGHGLNCLHRIGIIHRNLKPKNILVDWNGSLKITDFSCAYIEPSSSSTTRMPRLVSGMHYAYRTRGTPEYMAPEVFEMTTRSAIAKFGKDDVDEQIAGLKGSGKEVDIWALGCVAAEILRQKDGYEQLFERPGSRDAFIWASQGEQFGRLESFGIHAHLAVDLVHSMLQANPSQRLQLEQMEGHFYYSPTTSAKSFKEYLDTRYAKGKSLPLVLDANLSAAPTSPDCVLELSAKFPKRTRPSIDSDEGYTWINPVYLTDD